MKRNKSFYHRLFILFIILILPVFFYKEYRLIKSKKETRVLPAEDFCQAHLDPHEDKSFTFIILTHNNADSIKQNMQSVTRQNYHHYKVVYIDQGSTDGTKEQIARFKAQEKYPITLIECERESEAYENYYNVVQNSSDSEVIIHLYGSDWLAHDDVLERLNQSYMNPDVWLTYGQYLDYSNYQKGIYNPQPKKVLYKKRVQRAPWVVASFKTYYASLFKEIEIEQGYFLSIESDNALLLPMVELAKAHVRFIPDVLTIHKEKAPKEKRGHKLAFMAGKMAKSIPHQKLADLVIFSDNNPEKLKTCLQSTESYLKGVNVVHVIYQSNEESYSEYEKVKEEFPKVSFIRPASYAEAGFKSSLLNVLQDHTCPYIVLTTDHVSIDEPISLPLCVEAMRKTRAYGFYFHLGKGVEQVRGAESVEKGIYMWNIRKNEGPWGEPDTLQMGLYRRLDLEMALKELSFSSAKGLIKSWAQASNSYRVGLSFDEPITSTICVQPQKEF